MYLQGLQPVEHGLPATGLERVDPTRCADLKLVLWQILYLVGQGGIGDINCSEVHTEKETLITPSLRSHYSYRHFVQLNETYMYPFHTNNNSMV